MGCTGKLLLAMITAPAYSQTAIILVKNPVQMNSARQAITLSCSGWTMMKSVGTMYPQGVVYSLSSALARRACILSFSAAVNQPLKTSGAGLLMMFYQPSAKQVAT